VLPVTPRTRESGRPGSNGPNRVGGPVLCLLSYVRVMKPPAGVEPAPRPYKGRMLAVDTTEALMETVGVEPTPPRCKRGALPPELHPQVRTGGVEPPQP
jgi:hypothetical protein